MPPRTRGSNLQLVAPVDNWEWMARQAALGPQTKIDGIRPMGCRENMLGDKKLMTRLLEKTSDRMDTDRDSLSL